MLHAGKKNPDKIFVPTKASSMFYESHCVAVWVGMVLSNVKKNGCVHVSSRVHPWVNFEGSKNEKNQTTQHAKCGNREKITLFSGCPCQT